MKADFGLLMSYKKIRTICERSEESGYRSLYSDWLRAGRPRDRSSSPGRVKNVFFSTSPRPALGVHPAFSQMCTGGKAVGALS
jgi:hypothetical protein